MVELGVFASSGNEGGVGGSQGVAESCGEGGLFGVVGWCCVGLNAARSRLNPPPSQTHPTQKTHPEKHTMSQRQTSARKMEGVDRYAKGCIDRYKESRAKRREKRDTGITLSEVCTFFLH